MYLENDVEYSFRGFIILFAIILVIVDIIFTIIPLVILTFFQLNNPSIENVLEAFRIFEYFLIQHIWTAPISYMISKFLYSR